MRALGQPAHHPFGAEDRHAEALGVAVQGRADLQAAGAQQVVAGGEVVDRRGDMLDHLHVEHHIELLARGRHVLGGGVAIVDLEARLLGVQPGHGDVARGGVGTDHRRAQPRHRLAQQPAAAADVEQAQALERRPGREIAVELRRDLLGDVAQPAGVEHVQRLELAVLVPPFGGHRLELGDLLRVDGGAGGIGLRHGFGPSSSLAGDGCALVPI